MEIIRLRNLVFEWKNLRQEYISDMCLIEDRLLYLTLGFHLFEQVGVNIIRLLFNCLLRIYISVRLATRIPFLPQSITHSNSYLLFLFSPPPPVRPLVLLLLFLLIGLCPPRPPSDVRFVRPH